MRDSKYNAHRTAGFASRLEAQRASELTILARAGHIYDLRTQPQVYLTDAGIGYRPDFSYIEIDCNGQNRLIYEDTKGFETDRWRIIKKLWKVYGPGPLRVMVRASGNRIMMKEEIGG
jgi:hypothetical protein